MNENVLCAIYSAYLDDEFNGIQPLRASDLKCEYEKLGVFEKKHNISAQERFDFETDILNEFTNASERKGFTNGFKLALQLAFEIYGKTTERAC